MKMINFSQFGSFDVLDVCKGPIPKHDDHQILIKMNAAGINRIDCKIREGSSFVAQQIKDTLPSCLGYEFSGEVVSIGKKVKNFSIGEKVVGTSGFPDNPNCYAEFIVVSPNSIIKLPSEISVVEAAALPLVGLTALQAINKIDLKKNERVLVQAGSGGVGHLVIQLAKLKGAKVITTAEKSNHEMLMRLGADQCIDYLSEDFRTVIDKPVDAVIDLVGGGVGLNSLEVLAKDGRMITVPTITSEKIIDRGKELNKTVFGMIVNFNMVELGYLVDLIYHQSISICVYRVFDLEEAQSAHRLLESGGVKFGKIVLTVKNK